MKLNDTTPTTKIDVSWTAPDMTGKPDISGYDLEYRQHGDDDWTDTNFSGTGTSKTLSGLTAGKSYEVQVRAVNNEGNGAWGTDSVITKANGITRSVDENSAVGSSIGAPVTASSNPDNYTLTHTLSGTDADKFDIGLNDGQLKVKSGNIPNYEAKTSYSVTVTVKGVGGRGAGAEPEPRSQPPGRLRRAGNHQRDGRKRAPGPARRPDGNFDGQLGQHHAAREVDCPDMTGKPAITDYDVQYQKKGDSTWKSHPFTGTSTSITGQVGGRQLQRAGAGHERRGH